MTSADRASAPQAPTGAPSIANGDAHADAASKGGARGASQPYRAEKSPPPALRALSDLALRLEADAFPDAALERAALLTLDTLGVAAAAAPMRAGRIAAETACAVFAAGAPQTAARILFDGRSVSAPGAAYAAASAIDNLDAHDGDNLAKGHVGVAAVPAVAALCEGRARVTGRQALAAITVVYEVAARAGRALHATVSDYHTSGAWNALGVAAAAARLRCFDDETLRQALGVAEFHGPRSQMMREIANPTMLHDGSGWGALVGLTAAELAERGFDGAPALTVEAPEVADFWSDLGARWAILDQYVKPYPVCRWAHAAIDAAKALRARSDLALDAIARIEIDTFEAAAALYRGAPDTTSQAQYSLGFAVAAMLVHGDVGLAEIDGAGLQDPRVLALLEKVEVRADVRHTARFPQARWSSVVITLADGRRLESAEVNARGGTDARLSRDEIVEKFHAYADPTLGAARAARLRDALSALTRPQTRFAELAGLLYQPVG